MLFTRPFQLIGLVHSQVTGELEAFSTSQDQYG